MRPIESKGLNLTDSMVHIKKVKYPKCFDSRCNLCLEEKIQILLYPEPEKLLSKRCELIARCRHRAKFKLLKINIIDVLKKNKHRIKLRINVNE